MKKHKLWLAATIVLWAAAAALRWWQLSSAFEEDPRLAIPFAPASVALLVLLIAAAVVLALLARRQEVAPDLKEDWARALYAPGDKLYLTGLVLAGFLALAGGFAFLRQGISLFQKYLAVRAQQGDLAGMNNGLLRLLAGAAGVAMCPTLIGAGRDAVRSKGSGLPRIGAVCGCLWMMDCYRSHAADPVRWDYVPLILAIVAGIGLCLCWSGLTCGAPRPRRTLWLAGMTVILSAMAMVGENSLGAVLLLASQAFTGLSLLYRLPRNLNDPPAAPAEEPRPEETMEDEPHA